MSKRLYIVVEGQTEEEFVKDLIAPYLLGYGIFTVPTIIRTSTGHKGGFVNYQHLVNDIRRLLKSQGSDVVVTTFVDFFRCPDFPNQKHIDRLPTHLRRIEEMENALRVDINDWRFVPYIQMHEFEALLFSSIQGFSIFFDENVVKGVQKVIDEFENPEEINSAPETAPSKRLLKIIADYNKVMYGNLVAMEIGLPKILERCPRFRSWIQQLIDLGK